MSRVRAVVLAAGLTAAACGGSSTTADPGTPGTPGDDAITSTTGSSATPTTVVSLPASAPDGFDTAGILTGPALTVDGSQFDLASLQGKDLVVWFWAPW